MKNIFNKKQNIIKLFLFLIMIFFFIRLGTKDYGTNHLDNEKFSLEYKDISKNNCFVYINSSEVLEILNGKSAILFFGFPSNIWSHYYAEYLNEMALLNNVKVSYYNFYKDRNNNGKNYLEIVQHLKKYLNLKDTNTLDLTAPMVLFVDKGEIFYVDNRILFLEGDKTPEEYFDVYQKNIIKANFDNAIKEYLKRSK